MKTFEQILRKNCVVKIDTENGYEFTDVPLQRIIDAHKEYEAQSRQAAVSGTVCVHPNEKRVNWHDEAILCEECNCIISQFGEEINPPTPLC